MKFSACAKNLASFDNDESFTYLNANKRRGDYLVGTEVNYSCNSGYEPNNSGEATCTFDGIWDPPVSCNEITNITITNNFYLCSNLFKLSLLVGF